MTTLYAQPYDLDARGFYFSNLVEYNSLFTINKNRWGAPVEEYELQFIDGDTLDGKLFDELSINQCTIGDYFDAIDEWSEEQKVKIIIAVGEVGYCTDTTPKDLEDFDLYTDMTLKDLVEQFIDEGVYGEIPESIQYYLDYDKMARDLAMDHTETRIDGTDYVYRAN